MSLAEIPEIHPSRLVLLDGSFELIHFRLASREHFMKVELLQSQFELPDKPKGGMRVDIDQLIDTIIQQIVPWLGEEKERVKSIAAVGHKSNERWFNLTSLNRFEFNARAAWRPSLTTVRLAEQ